MFGLHHGILYHHDIRLVVLAGLICALSTAAAVLLLRQARELAGPRRVRWTIFAGITTGLGVWATHFVAMLGYEPGMVLSYRVGGTVASLLVAIAMTIIGFTIALRTGDRAKRWLAAVVIGSGVAAMHYLGMSAVNVPGLFAWSPPLVVLSIVFAIVPTYPALRLALDRDSLGEGLGASALLSLAILALHFMGMAAVRLIPGATAIASGPTLSSASMAISIAIVTLAVLILCIAAAVISQRSRAATAAREREFSLLVQGITDCAIYMLDRDGRVASWNAGAQRLKGYSTEEAVGLPVERFYLPEDRERGIAALGLRTAREEGKFTAEGWRVRKDGSRFWAHVTIERVLNERGEFSGYAKITRDMTRFKEDQDRLTALTENLDTALSNMHQGLCLFDADERLIMSNERAGEMFGVSTDVCPLGTPFRDVLRMALSVRAGAEPPAELLEEAYQRHRQCIAQPQGGTLMVDFTADCTLAISHRPMPGGGWVTTYDDITDRRRAEAQIAHMALHDGLTGLPNRTHFNEQLDGELARAARAGSHVAVAAIDLDRFKEINDTYGHAAGDQVLRLLSERLRDALIGEEQIARLGGDEFAAFKRYNDDGERSDFVSRLETALTEPLDLDGTAALAGASLGIAVYPGDGETREQVLNNADLAMYRAKANMGRQVCYYEHGMDEAARARRLLSKDLREALARNEFHVAYQEQRSIVTGEILGFEALLRWLHPTRGWVPPSEFIPVAEENGEIVAIGEWVLRTACAQAVTWDQPYRVAINLSAVQLMRLDLVAVVTTALLDTGLPPSRLELEITETAIIGDKLRALHALRQIKALGVTIAIDDFGTGYSSLDTLNSFPFDKIKIDRSFLSESEHSEQARAIIRAILALGQSLNMPVLAEGVENEHQLRLLEREGCDEAQGYFFGRPAIPVETPEALQYRKAG